MTMASNNMDPLQTLQAALAVPANSKEQADILGTLREYLESHPGPIPVLVGTLINSVANAGDSLLKRWVVDLFSYAIARAEIPVDQKTQMAFQALDTLSQLIDDPNISIIKTVIQCLATVYPLLFRAMCTNRSNPAAWTTLSACKSRILDFVWTPTVPTGIRIAAVKFLQRVILVQTRGIPDPRLQNRNDPNITFCPADHPFISVQRLEAEGNKLVEGSMAFLYSSQNPDLLSAMINSWGTLTKVRPNIMSIIVAALKQWTPLSLVHLPAPTIKSVEKSIRILLIHLSRIPNNSQLSHIQEALQLQAARLEKALLEEKQRKSGLLLDNRKRPSADEAAGDAKRPKLEADSATSSILTSFDFTTLPSTLITELIVANLDAFSEAALITLVQNYRQSKGLLNADGAPPVAIASQPSTSTPPPPPQRVAIKQEPVDPLQMDIDQDEMEYEPDRLNEELSGSLPTADEEYQLDSQALADLSLLEFKLPPPRELGPADREGVIAQAVTRIWDGGEDMRVNSIDPLAAAKGESPQSRALDMWMLLLVRMITRVAEPPKAASAEQDVVTKKTDEESEDFYERQDNLRKTLCDYIMSDFAPRVRLATTWMNEEWYNDQIRQDQDRDWRPNYDYWLGQIIATYQLEGKDRSFSQFLLDLPSVPSSVVGVLQDLAVDTENLDRRYVGFTTLRSLITQRPALRQEALNVLLELTTHPDKKIRMAAINTVKVWVPNAQPMGDIIRDFAMQLLRKLQSHAPRTPKVVASSSPLDGDFEMINGDSHPVPNPESLPNETEENMEDGQLPQEEMVQTPYLPESIELPAQTDLVLQHMELVFALCTKAPQFLDEIFEAYGQMDVTVQEAIQDLITALIRSLGSSNSKLLTLMRNCPTGAESLALRILTIFTESGKPSPQLVALVKALINERDLDARFLIPIIAEMDKPDIMRHLPRIVSILNGQPDPKNLVRSVFSSIVTTPPQTFGSVTSNLPRVRQSELLTPAELMVLLHESEKEIGLKSAMEAIAICFSMTDVFRPEILAVVMQQIIDEPTLPVLFMRTVIQAVKTYTTLVPFVSTTLLSRLITKKVWTNPPLWEGFIVCAVTTAPQSFGALLQLPREQLRELVDKQPKLKSGLREFVTKKAPNKARVAGFLDLFGETDSPGQTPPPKTEMSMAVD